MNVELIAYTPNPDAVCNLSAGTCVSEDIPVMETSVNKYRALKGALESGHESVVEHVSFTFAISGVSRALTHQLVRHRMASFSQQSQRYVNMDWFEYVTPKSIESPDKEVMYSFYDDETTGFYKEGFSVRETYHKLMHDIAVLYRKMVLAGIPEEDARYILPNACCTNIVVSVNARELRHIAGLRMCARAQWEIRELVTKMVELAKEVAPTIFDGVGARCEQLGYCIEQRGCGKYPKKS